MQLSLSLSLSFSVATSRFCEAILDFLADHKRASEAHIRAEDFEGEAYSIYELFSTVWLQSKEAKVNMHLCAGTCILYAVILIPIASFGGCRGDRLHCTPCVCFSA